MAQELKRREAYVPPMLVDEPPAALPEAAKPAGKSPAEQVPATAVKPTDTRREQLTRLINALEQGEAEGNQKIALKDAAIQAELEQTAKDAETEKEQKAAQQKKPEGAMDWIKAIFGMIIGMMTGSWDMVKNLFGEGKDFLSNMFGGGAAETPKTVSFLEGFHKIEGLDHTPNKGLTWTFKALQELRTENPNAPTKDGQKKEIDLLTNDFINQIEKSLKTGDSAIKYDIGEALGHEAVKKFLKGDNGDLRKAITEQLINTQAPTGKENIEHAGLSESFLAIHHDIAGVSPDAGRSVLALEYFALGKLVDSNSNNLRQTIDLAAQQIVKGEHTGSAAEQADKTAKVLEFLKREGVENPDANNLDNIKSAIGKFVASGGKGGAEQQEFPAPTPAPTPTPAPAPAVSPSPAAPAR